MKISSTIKCITILGLIIAVLLTGCMDADMVQDINLENGTHVQEYLDDGLEIDLVINYPDKSVPHIYRTGLPRLDNEVAHAFLAAIGDPLVEILHDAVEDGWHNVALRTEKDAYFAYNRSEKDINLPGYALSYSLPMYSDYSLAFLNYGSQRETSPLDNSFLYREQKEFAFGTSEQARQQAESILRSLGIENAMLEETLYLDHELMTNYLRTPEAAEAIEVYNAQGLVDTGYDDSYDAYFFRFTLAQDGVLATAHRLETATSFIGATEMTILINAEGPVSVIVGMPWLFLDVEETPASLISPDTVLWEVMNQELDTLTEFPRIIDDLRLEYLPVQAGDHWLRMPIWIVSVLYKGAIVLSETECRDEHRFYLFDAVSGERIS